MTEAQVIEVINRLAALRLRNMPLDLRVDGREWHRALAQIDVHPDLLGDQIVATCRFWPTLPEVLDCLTNLELPPRKTQGCCESGWVEVKAWPQVRYKPCPNCFAATYNAWALDQAGWIDAG